MSITLKDAISIDLTKDSTSAQSADTSKFLFFNTLNNRFPNWLNLLFKLILLTFFLLKKFKFNILGFLINIYYLKKFCYTSTTLGIVIQLLNLYFWLKFSSSNCLEV